MVWGKKRRQEPKCCDVFTFSEYSCGAELTLFAHRKSFYRTHHAKLTEGRGKKMEILIKVEKYFLVSKGAKYLTSSIGWSKLDKGRLYQN